MAADIIQFPAKIETDVLSTVREYFDAGPRERINPQLVSGDRFLAWLWLRGFKVVPLNEGDR